MSLTDTELNRIITSSEGKIRDDGSKTTVMKFDITVVQCHSKGSFFLGVLEGLCAAAALDSGVQRGVSEMGTGQWR